VIAWAAGTSRTREAAGIQLAQHVAAQAAGRLALPQYSHTPQPQLGFRTTRAPTAGPVTPDPLAHHARTSPPVMCGRASALRHAFPREDVEEVQSARLDTDDDLARSRRRRGQCDST